MTFATMHYIPLASAYLCQDCNCVSNCAIQCPACASIVLMGLSGVLNREPEVIAKVTYPEFPSMAA
jgi:hypothetical protein